MSEMNDNSHANEKKTMVDIRLRMHSLWTLIKWCTFPHQELWLKIPKSRGQKERGWKRNKEVVLASYRLSHSVKLKIYVTVTSFGVTWHDPPPPGQWGGLIKIPVEMKYEFQRTQRSYCCDSPQIFAACKFALDSFSIQSIKCPNKFLSRVWHSYAQRLSGETMACVIWKSLRFSFTYLKLLHVSWLLQPMLNLERHSNVLQNCNLFSIFYINEQNCKDRHLILENCREIRNLDKSGILFWSGIWENFQQFDTRQWKMIFSDQLWFDGICLLLVDRTICHL